MQNLSVVRLSELNVSELVLLMAVSLGDVMSITMFVSS